MSRTKIAASMGACELESALDVFWAVIPRSLAAPSPAASYKARHQSDVATFCAEQPRSAEIKKYVSFFEVMYLTELNVKHSACCALLHLQTTCKDIPKERARLVSTNPPTFFLSIGPNPA